MWGTERADSKGGEEYMIGSDGDAFDKQRGSYKERMTRRSDDNMLDSQSRELLFQAGKAITNASQHRLYKTIRST